MPVVDMTTTGSGDGGVPGLIAKLGHADEGVRVRALASLRFKLANGLATHEELWQRGGSDIFPLLLEWFNFPAVPMQAEVLELMHSMCASSGEAATMLAQAGGITFLQAMKTDTPREHLGVVQAILNLLLLSAPPMHHGSAYSYPAAHSPDASWSDAPSALSPHSSVHTPGTVGGISFLSRTTAGVGARSERFSAVCSAASAGHVPEQHTSQAQLRLQQQHLLLQQNQRLYQMIFEESSWEVPLVKLSKNDNQRIFELDVKLKLTDAGAILEALEALQQTLVRDFPAEVLLQKPEVFRNLLALIQTTDDLEIDARALALMHEWVAALKASLRMQLLAEVKGPPLSEPPDAAADAAAHAAASALARHTLETAGVLRAEDDAASMRYPGRIGAGITGVLPPHQAAHLIYSKAIPLLQHSSRITSVVLLLRAAHPLLFFGSLPPYADGQQAHDAAATPRPRRCCDSQRMGEHLQSLSAVIAYHGGQKVMGCRVKSSLLTLMADLCEAVPAEQRKALVPSQLVQLMLQIVTNPYLDVVSANLRTRVAALLQPLDPAAYSIYEEMCAARESLLAARCAFGADAAVLSMYERVDGLERVMGGLAYDASRADAAVDALLDALLALASADASLPDLQQRLWSMLLRTLACDSSAVRVSAYQRMRTRLEAGDTSGSGALLRASTLLLDHEVVYQLVLHGLGRSDTQQHAEAVLLALVSMHGPARVCSALVCTLPLAVVYVQGGGGGEQEAAARLSDETRSLLWAAHKVAATEEQALALASVMLGQDAAARILAASQLFDLLQEHGCVLQAAGAAPPTDPLAFLASPSHSDPTLREIFQDTSGGGDRSKNGHLGGGGSVFETHDLSNLVRVVASESLKEPIRLAAAQQLLQLASAAQRQEQALLLGAGLLEVLQQMLASRASGHLLTTALHLLLVMLRTPSTRSLVRQWDYVKALCRLVFHPMLAVRARAALCVGHLALAPERLKAAAYRKPEFVAREVDDMDESAAAQAVGFGGVPPVCVPQIFKGRLLSSIPAQMYAPACCHAHQTIGHKDVVARALHRMQQVEDLASLRGAGRSGTNACQELAALDAATIVEEALQALHASRSHGAFIANLASLVNVCGADPGLAEEFFRRCWVGSVERILTTLPTSESDNAVLEALLAAVATLLGALDCGRVAPGKTLRFMVHVVKVYLLPTLSQDDVEMLAAGVSGDAQGHPPGHAPRHKLHKTILALVQRLLEHDQSSGARLVTPALQADDAGLSILMDHCQVILEARDRRRGPRRLLQGLAALDCLVLLTRDAHWMASYGQGGLVRGRAGQAGVRDTSVLFQRLAEPLTNMLMGLYGVETTTTGGLVVECAAGVDARNTFIDKSLVRLALTLLVQLLGNAELARLWRRAFFEFSDTQWLQALVSDRETQVRALGLALLGSAAISLVDPAVAAAELDILRHTQPLAPGTCVGEGGGGAGADALIQAPQHLEFLNMCCERALNAEEADLVRQQAMDYIISCTRPPASPASAADDDSQASSGCFSMREPENLTSNLHGAASKEGGHAGSGSSRAQAPSVDARGEVAHEARTASVLQVLNHHKFLDKLVDMLPPASDEGQLPKTQGWRVLSGAIQVLHNLARTPGTQGVMWSLLSSPVVARRLLCILDIGALWRISTAPPAPCADTCRLPCMHGTLLHRQQWLALTAPSILHGAAALCTALRVIIESQADADPNGGSRESVQASLLEQTALVPLLVSLLCLRPAKGTSCRLGGSPDPALERCLLMEAEVAAKESAASLLCLLLRPRGMDLDKEAAAAAAGWRHPMAGMQEQFASAMQAAELLLQPLYPPRLNFLGAVLVARLVALVPAAVQHPSPRACPHRAQAVENGEGHGSEGGAAGGGGRCTDAEGVSGGGDEVEVALAKRLLALYHDVCAPGPRRQARLPGALPAALVHEQAVAAGLGALLSYSSAAKEHALGVGFVQVLVSRLEACLAQLPLQDLDHTWTSTQKTPARHLRAPLRRTCATGPPLQGFDKSSLGGRRSAGSSGRRGSVLAHDWARCGGGQEREGEGEAVQGAVRLLTLLSNALYGSDGRFKEASLEAGVPRVLWRLLARPALLHQNRTALPLLRAALRVLVNLVARSPEARRVMAQPLALAAAADASAGGEPRQACLLQLTILCCDMGMHHKAGRGPSATARPPCSLDESKGSTHGRHGGEAARGRPWLHDLMSILSSSASCPECMPVLLKAAVVPCSLEMLQTAADAADAASAHALLDFLVALSRVEGGQQAILKVPDALVTVSDTRRSLAHHAEVRRRCALLLRNLCFSTEAKPYILSCQSAMAAIIGDLSAVSTSSLTSGPRCRAYAANAVWALLYNNQKAKACIKAQELSIRDRTMSVLDWLVHQHDALQADLALDSQEFSLDEPAASGGSPRAKCGVSNGGPEERGREVLLDSALESLRAALALALDQP